MKKSTLKLLIFLVLVLATRPNYPLHCQTHQKIVVKYGQNGFALGDSTGDMVTALKLNELARAGLIDSSMVGSEKHYSMFVPRRAVWSNLPEFFDSAVVRLENNILKQDLIVYELNADTTFKEAIIPDSLWIEEWTFSKKKIRKLPVIVKQNKNDFIYHNTSPGFLPAKHKSDLDEKAKEEKDKKDRLIKIKKDKYESHKIKQ